ncbi:MAG: dihydrofolate reductase [Ruminococcaceae bacterium]|nr:dihydrofolate reductase [Oscillospiraceae bacterium]
MISMIAAIGKNNELGKGNDLIWHLKDDMKFFRSTTAGHTIIMGRKTFESLGGLLPKRHHVILTANKGFSFEGTEVHHTVESILEKYKNAEEECFVIGGGEIYKLFLPHADKLYLTHINAECEDAEVFFPALNAESYEKSVLQTIEEDGITAEITEYTAK